MTWKPDPRADRLRAIKDGSYRKKADNLESKEKAPEKDRAPKKAPKKPIAKVSKKRAKENRQYTPIKKKFLTDNPICQAQLESCTGTTTDLHHAAGRTGKQLLKVDDFIAVCRSCHDKIEAEDKAARETGLKKTRLGKPSK